MKILKLPTPRRRRKSDAENWDEIVYELAVQLCPTVALSLPLDRKTRFKPANLIYFPAWRAYRKEANKIAKLRKKFPLLGFCPLFISRWLCRFFAIPD